MILHYVIIMAVITAALKPVLLAFLVSPAVKRLVVDLLAAYAGTTDNKIDDALVGIVEDALRIDA
jgi:hypothetical protein